MLTERQAKPWTPLDIADLQAVSADLKDHGVIDKFLWNNGFVSVNGGDYFRAGWTSEMTVDGPFLFDVDGGVVGSQIVRFIDGGVEIRTSFPDGTETVAVAYRPALLRAQGYDTTKGRRRGARSTTSGAGPVTSSNWAHLAVAVAGWEPPTGRPDNDSRGIWGLRMPVAVPIQIIALLGPRAIPIPWIEDPLLSQLGIAPTSAESVAQITEGAGWIADQIVSGVSSFVEEHAPETPRGGPVEIDPKVGPQQDDPPDAPYSKATPQERSWTLLLIGRHLARGGDAAAIDRLLGVLTGSPGFERLPPKRREQLIWLLGGTNPLSSRARARYQDRLLAPDWSGLSREGQLYELESRFRAPIFEKTVEAPPIPGRPSVLGTVHEGDGEELKEIRFADHAFELRDLTADLRRADLYYPSADDVIRVVGTLSTEARQLLERVVIAAEPPVDDPHTVMEAEPGGTITIYPSTTPILPERFDTDFRHEMGHLWSFRALSLQDWETFVAGVDADGINISGYSNAKLNHGEKLSELYALLESLGPDQVEELRHIAPQQMQVLSLPSRW
jgi:hypothetical protein